MNRFTLILGFYCAASMVKGQSDSLKHAFHLDFFSPITNNLTFGYEYSGLKGYSLELEAGIIGLDNRPEARGSFYRLTGKFEELIHPSIADFLFVQMNPSFFKVAGVQDPVRSVAFMVGAGERWGSGRFYVELHSAIGWALTNRKSRAYYYGYFILDRQYPIALSFGLSFVYRFNLNKTGEVYK